MLHKKQQESCYDNAENEDYPFQHSYSASAETHLASRRNPAMLAVNKTTSMRDTLTATGAESGTSKECRPT